jgi:ribosomal protein S18 acetylase RimI-like enzyme
MSALSNLFRPRDVPRPSYRAVQRHEIEQAMRLVVGNSKSAASDEQVLDFLSFALDRGIDVNATWVADVGGRIEWALLPVVSPGRTMLLFTPAKLPRRDLQHAVAGLSDALHEHFAARGVVLSQMLIDPKETALLKAYAGAGFARLTELYYLQANIRGSEPMPAPPPGWTVTAYNDLEHAEFASTIQQSYQGSQDCPSLNGVREMADVIAGHKAAGDFDPRLWFLVRENGQSLGTLLLNRSAGNTSVELVYLGLPPAARGRGVGDFLMRWALAVAGLENRKHLSLAVDSANAPALRLYYRHGLMRIGSRVAMVRDLRGLKSFVHRPASRAELPV